MITAVNVTLQSNIKLLSSQEENPDGTVPHLGRHHGHRVFLRRRNRIRFPHPAQDRRGPRPHDLGLGSLAASRLLFDASAGVAFGSVPAEAGQAAAVHFAPVTGGVVR